MTNSKYPTDVEIRGKAEALRAETIRNFIVDLFEKREQIRETQPINAVPAE